MAKSTVPIPAEPAAPTEPPAPVAPATPVEQIKALLKGLQDQKTALQNQIVDIDKQLAEIATELGGAPPSATNENSPESTKGKGKGRGKKGKYVPRPGSYAAHILESLKDGKEQHREAIGKAVVAKMGGDYKEESFGQAMTLLSKKKILKSGGKRGMWKLN